MLSNWRMLFGKKRWLVSVPLGPDMALYKFFVVHIVSLYLYTPACASQPFFLLQMWIVISNVSAFLVRQSFPIQRVLAKVLKNWIFGQIPWQRQWEIFLTGGTEGAQMSKATRPPTTTGLEGKPQTRLVKKSHRQELVKKMSQTRLGGSHRQGLGGGKP